MNTGLWESVADALSARDVRAAVVREGGPSDHDPDLVVELRARDHARRYGARLVENVTAAGLARLDPSSGRLGMLVVAPYVSASMAAKCRALHIEFADAEGNMYLRLPDALLDVEGRRPSTPPGRPDADRLFRPSGLKVVFALLCDPDLASAPFRTLTEEARTSLGSVAKVMDALVAEGYVEEHPAGRRLHRTHRLFDRWVEAFHSTLRPRLTLGWYDTDDPATWLSPHTDVSEYGAQYGGEVAAAVLRQRLRPGSALVYTDGPTRALVHRYRLRPAARSGLVELRARFWGDRVGMTSPLPWCVPTPLVYADLVASDEARQVEEARLLRETDDVLRRIDAR